MTMLFLILLVMVLATAINMADNAREHKQEPRLAQCPPHKWGYKEINDDKGNLVRWQLVCDWCGPLCDHQK